MPRIAVVVAFGDKVFIPPEKTVVHEEIRFDALLGNEHLAATNGARFQGKNIHGSLPRFSPVFAPEKQYTIIRMRLHAASAL